MSLEQVEFVVPRWSHQLRCTLDMVLESAKERLREERSSAEPIVIRLRSGKQVIPIEMLDHVEAQADYVALYAAGTRFLKLQPISALESELDPRRFVRVHRSRIVNVERIARIRRQANEGFVVLTDGTRLPISRAGYDRLLSAIGYGDAPARPRTGDLPARQMIQ